MADGLSRMVTDTLARARDGLARGLIRRGATPNGLTLAGLIFTIGAGLCLAIGVAQPPPGADVPPVLAEPGQRDWWLWLAAALILLAGSMDILDGAVARLAHQSTDGGAFLDSVLDRFSDIALYIGMGAGFAWRGNFTYTLLAVVAMSHAVVIPYARARAEVLIAHCKVGYWERGERIAAILIAAACHQVPAALWLLATLPLLTAVRRIVYTLRVIAHRRRTGEDLSETHIKPIGAGLYRLAWWRYPRGSLAHNLVTAANVLWIVLAPVRGGGDPIRSAIAALIG